MTIEVYYDQVNDCVIGRLTGVADRQTLIDHVQQVARVMSQHNCKCAIIDLQRIEPDVSTMDLRGLPEEFEKIMSLEGIRKKSLKRAVVVSKDPKSFGYALYYEIESQYKGHIERVFTDMNEAMSWLKSDSL